ncbi:MAG: response regulator [Planctomycetes bacterium]|nr:response regulator [Planctomycetota bacterium]
MTESAAAEAGAVAVVRPVRALRDGLVAGLGILVLLIACSVPMFWQWRHALDDEIRGMLRRRASMVAELIDVPAHATYLRRGDERVPEYQRQIDVLRRVQRGDGLIVAIYTCVLIDQQVCTIVDAAESRDRDGDGSPDDIGIRIPVANPDPILRRALTEGVLTESIAPRTDATGTFLLACAPIGGDGKVVAVACVELSYGLFAERQAVLTQTAFAGVGCAVLLALLVGVAVARLRRHAGDAQRRLADSVAQLGAARDEAEAATAAKSTFLATMSHELRTPMNGVVGMLELMAGTPLNPQQGEYIETARRSAQGLLGVLNDILDLSKIEAGRLTIHTEEFDFENLIGDVADMLAELARKKGIELAYQMRPLPFPRVVGDGQRIRQVLVNLVGNAVKFTQRGFVTMRIAILGEDGDGIRIRVEVQDTGPGIGPGEMEKLFRPFSQLDGSHRRVHGGTGLGLAISRRLVELMQGTIGVDSRLGQGSVFWFEVPLQRAGKAAMRLPVSRSLTLIGPPSLGQQQLMADAKALTWPATFHTELAKGVAAITQAAEPKAIVVIDARALPDDDAVLAAMFGANGSLRGNCDLVVVLGDGRRTKLSGLQDPAVALLWYLWPFPIIRFLRELDNRDRGGPAAVQRILTKEASLGLRVLVAEDNEVNQRVTLAMLRKLGCEAVVVPDGVLAVAQAERGRFDCILMDCMMPRMDGYQATQQIRQRERAGSARLPILALTANAMVGDKERCLASGMDGVITKPVVLQDLSSALWDVKRGKDKKA